MMIYKRGGTYPNSLPSNDGPVLDFLATTVNRLVVCETNIPNHEIPMFMHGPMSAGLLLGPGAMRFVWRIFDADGDPFFTFDTPFDPRLLQEVHLFKIENQNTRMVVHFHLVERSNSKLLGIRSFTLDPRLTRVFHNAVIGMQRDSNDGKTANAVWDFMQPSDLAGVATMYMVGL